MYKVSKLKNKLTVLKVPIRGSKSVLVQVFVKTGSRNEEKRLNGVSHFLEHLFFKGSAKYPTAQELSHALDAIGAEYNAFTGKEYTGYYIKAAKDFLPFIFEVLSDVIKNPVFAEDEIKREKGVIIEEINMYEDMPMRNVDEVLEEVMWPGERLGRKIAGTKETIPPMTRDDIMKYKETHYQPENMILAVAGSFSDKKFDALVKAHWGDVFSKKTPQYKKVSKKQRKKQFKVEDKKTEQYHLSLGFESYDYNHADNVSQVVLAAILGGGMSSRLFTEVRERLGLAYYVKAGTSNYQDTGNFYIKAGIRADALPRAVKTILLELQKIKKEPVPEKELQKVKDYLKGTLTLSLEDSENILGWFLEQVSFKKKIMEPEQIFKKIDQIHAKDVLRVAQDIFQTKNLNLVVIGPKNGTSKIEKLLKV